MTRAEILDCLTDRPCDSCKFHESGRCERWNCVFEEKPDDAEDCEDAINRAELLKAIDTWDKFGVDDTNSLFRLDNLSLPHYVPYIHYDDVIKCIKGMSSVTPKQKMGHCKDCKYFEYDSVAKVDGIPLIVAHEICSKWGDGCKTREDGYCFLYEPQESEDTE